MESSSTVQSEAGRKAPAHAHAEHPVSAAHCSSMQEYYKSLQSWLDAYRLHAYTAWNMMTLMPYIACASQMQWLQQQQQQQLYQPQGTGVPTSSSGTATGPGNAAAEGRPVGPEQPQNPGQAPPQQVPQGGAATQNLNNNIPQIPVLEFSVPSVYRRVVAELIDFVLLFSAKLSLMLVIIDYLGISDTTGFMMRFLVEEIEDDTSLEELQQMLLFAFLYRVIVCVYETFFLCSQMNRLVGGATPGKFLMRLRVISLEQVQTVGPGRVQVTLPDSVSFTQALLRSVVKNFSMAFFFPACVTVFFNPHFRAAYEVLTRTMVVGTENWPLAFPPAARQR